MLRTVDKTNLPSSLSTSLRPLAPGSTHVSNTWMYISFQCVLELKLMCSGLKTLEDWWSHPGLHWGTGYVCEKVKRGQSPVQHIMPYISEIHSPGLTSDGGVGQRGAQFGVLSLYTVGTPQQYPWISTGRFPSLKQIGFHWLRPILLHLS